MAEKVTAKEKEEKSSAQSKKKIDIDNLNLDAKVTVKNLAGWQVSFGRMDGSGDVTITPNGKQRLTRNEIQSQVNINNKLFTGVDGRGSHATIYIDDEATRHFVGFEGEDFKQNIFTDKLAKELFALPYDEFKNKLSEVVSTRAEKYAVIEAIKKLGINDYKKIVLTERHTGYKIEF